MNEQLVAIGAVGTLLSAVGSGAALYLRGRTRERLAALQGASSEDRVKLVAGAVAMFDVPAADLTKEQRYSLVVEQLRDRDRQRGRVFWSGLALMVVLAATTVALAVISPGAPGPAHGPATGSGAPAPDHPGSGGVHQSTTGADSPNFNGNGNSVVVSPEHQ